jgi:hypothetical protein
MRLRDLIDTNIPSRGRLTAEGRCSSAHTAQILNIRDRTNKVNLSGDFFRGFGFFPASLCSKI